MKTAVFGHDEICDDTTLSLNSGAIPPLTFAPPASLSVSSSLQIRGGISNAVSTYRSHHSRRTSRMQNKENLDFKTILYHLSVSMEINNVLHPTILVVY
ncbi:Clustered mitochondria protein [Dirofilaria immitis]